MICLPRILLRLPILNFKLILSGTDSLGLWFARDNELYDRGRMLEDIILLETSKALGKNYSVFKLQFNNSEFDMVIRDESNNTCAIYEIKHSKECVREQAKHLMNEEMLAMTIPRFGSLQGRYVVKVSTIAHR